MHSFLLEIQYDGSAYFGWQRQAGFLSIQEKLEEAIERATGEKTVLHGSGRTDTGVHAICQTAHFRANTKLSAEQMLRALNSYLPRDIVVRRCQEVSAKFHARFGARRKRYVYAVCASRIPRALGRAYFHWVPYPLDLKKMRSGAAHFLGKHDFRAFTSSVDKKKNTSRTISSFKVIPSKDLVLFFVEGDGFLQHMVRTMVGSLIEVGRGKMPAQKIGEILKSRNRTKAGPTAPAQGLYLLRVKYNPGSCEKSAL